MIPWSEINKLNNQIDIVKEFKDLGLELEQRGSNFSMICPFHDDHKLGNFMISPDKKIWSCFTCQDLVGKRILDFIVKYKKITLEEAFVDLAKKNGFDISHLNIKKDPLDDPKYQKSFKISNQAVEYYKNNLQTNSMYKEYLTKKRMINEETINFFNIGASTENKTYLFDTLNKNTEFTDIDIQNTGLISKGENFTFDRFHSRIIIPFIDNKNRVIGFSGRAYKDNIEPKYLYPPTNELFKKSREIYNIHNAKNSLIKDTIILVEGNFDVIAMHQKGFKNTASVMGAKIMPEQVAELKKSNVKNIILMFDNDDAGVQGMAKSIETIADNGYNLNNIQVSKIIGDCKDPDDLVKKREYDDIYDLIYKKTIDPIDFLLLNQKKLADMDTKFGIKEFAENCIKIIKRYSSQISVESYLKKIAKISRYEYEEVDNIFNNTKQVIKRNNNTEHLNSNINQTYIDMPNVQNEMRPKRVIRASDINEYIAKSSDIPQKNKKRFMQECEIIAFFIADRKNIDYFHKLNYKFSFESTQKLYETLIMYYNKYIKEKLVSFENFKNSFQNELEQNEKLLISLIVRIGINNIQISFMELIQLYNEEKSKEGV